VSSKHISSVCNGTGNRTLTGGYIWKHVEDKRCEEPEGKIYPGYENYIITTKGEVYSKKAKKFLVLNGKNNPRVYLRIKMGNGGTKQKDFYVHVLVAKLYIPTIEGKNFVNHINGNKHYNNVSNLEWVTESENMQHYNDI